MEATVTNTNERYGPYVRHETGDIVSGHEADRLVGLGLAVYNDEVPQEDSTESTTHAPVTVTDDSEPEQKES